MKKLLSIAAMAALVLTGCNKDLKVTPTDKLTVEYGDKLDNNKLFDAKKSDKNIKVDKVQDFNAKKVGDQTLKVTFTDGDKTIQKDVKITVKDTKKPEIVLKKDKVTITAGDKLDLKDNVKSVKDPVDGALKYSDKETKKSGYYIDKGKLNTKKAGTYEVIVKAFDVNGNKTEKKFKVIVKKKEKAKATTE
ncbi:MAG: flagellar biosynthesis protein FlgM, partial [[Clostridium] innocuum]